MKKTLILIGMAAMLYGCNNNSNTNTEAMATTDTETVDTVMVAVDIPTDSVVEKAEETIEAVDSVTVRYLDALPADFHDGDEFGLILSYGGYGMDVSAWPMPDGDWLITWHWCMEEDESGTITRIDENGNEVPVIYNDPFEGQPYPVIHHPDLSFSTRNYGGETIHFYAAPDSDEILCSTNLKEIGLDVIAADLKTRRLLVRTNPNDWFWEKPGEEAIKLSNIAPDDSEDEFYFEEKNYPFVDLKGWIDEEWVCGNTMTTCP